MTEVVGLKHIVLVLKNEVNRMTNQLDDLLEKYWSIAHHEGESGESSGTLAGQVLHDIQKLYREQAERIKELEKSAELSTNFIQTVPDKCDRIVWKGDYYHLPLHNVPASRAWSEGYIQGIQDERTSESNIGIAGFSAKITPSRQNPYTAKDKLW